jgi:hypothetical protein
MRIVGTTYGSATISVVPCAQIVAVGDNVSLFIMAHGLGTAGDPPSIGA